jgi:hypothetical protein
MGCNLFSPHRRAPTGAHNGRADRLTGDMAGTAQAESRKIVADICLITLLNASGVLKGGDPCAKSGLVAKGRVILGLRPMPDVNRIMGLPYAVTHDLLSSGYAF